MDDCLSSEAKTGPLLHHWRVHNAVLFVQLYNPCFKGIVTASLLEFGPSLDEQGHAVIAFEQINEFFNFVVEKIGERFLDGDNRRKLMFQWTAQ